MSVLKKIMGGTNVPPAATQAQLNEAFGNDPEFVAACLKNKLSMEGAWKARAEAAEAELDAKNTAEGEGEEAGSESQHTEDAVEQPAGEPAATAAQLEAAFPDDPKFCLAQIKAGASMADAWKARAEAVQAELAKSKASARRLGAAGQGGHAGVTGSTPGQGAAVASAAAAAGGGTPFGAVTPSPLPFATGDGHPYMNEVRRVQAADGCSYAEAVNKVNKSRPDLQAAYVEDRGAVAKR